MFLLGFWFDVMFVFGCVIDFVKAIYNLFYQGWLKMRDF